MANITTTSASRNRRLTLAEALLASDTGADFCANFTLSATNELLTVSRNNRRAPFDQSHHGYTLAVANRNGKQPGILKLFNDLGALQTYLADHYRIAPAALGWTPVLNHTQEYVSDWHGAGVYVPKAHETREEAAARVALSPPDDSPVALRP